MRCLRRFPEGRPGVLSFPRLLDVIHTCPFWCIGLLHTAVSTFPSAALSRRTPLRDGTHYSTPGLEMQYRLLPLVRFLIGRGRHGPRRATFLLEYAWV